MGLQCVESLAGIEIGVPFSQIRFIPSCNAVESLAGIEIRQQNSRLPALQHYIIPIRDKSKRRTGIEPDRVHSKG